MATPVANLGRRIGELTNARISERYAAVRTLTEILIEPLSAEDTCVQSMPDASPAKWHLAHVTWFFETFVLEPHETGFKPFHPAFRELFNSYYNSIGEQYPRMARGMITRPSLAEVIDYRHGVDERIGTAIETADRDLLGIIELGLHHEQQHQELLLMDIKHLLSLNPSYPSYRDCAQPEPRPLEPRQPVSFAGGLVEIGHDDFSFRYDNETPRHKVWLEPFALESRPITNGEYLEFVESGCYELASLWLADGWTKINDEGWRSPGYWRRRDDDWFEFTLGGLEPLDLNAPVCHVSHYEADAFARWAGARLPSEFEWEAAVADIKVEGNFMDSGFLHPRQGGDGSTKRLHQAFGDVWEWTRSAYTPYPGFTTEKGAIGEYNGKFMSNQTILKGGSCATPTGHSRASYRNFFYPHNRWQFSGIRLAHDA
ncbi:MAG: ergothioneine biosynthesis protein EgtB [Gammaproteobacteria bacterium]|nr:ergothioneine biosynthesis protein EgtB [Gammaproteobacteria bacterium]